jgi:hypothetical protein
MAEVGYCVGVEIMRTVTSVAIADFEPPVAS